MSTGVDVVSLYGVVNAGVRARTVGFLERLDVPYRLHNYFDGNAAGAPELLRHPHWSIQSELHLRELARNGPKTLFMEREASPLSKGGIERRLLRSASHAVYDIDDALHHDVRSALFERLFSKGTKARRAAAAADVVIAGNDYLADWASEFNDQVVVIPTCIEPDDYRQKTNYEISGPPRLLWLGTRSGEPYLKLIEDALTRVHRETGAILTIIGDPTPRLGELERMIVRIEWSLELAHDTIADYDVGLMPLADTPYERGKCAYKLLEYGAAGVPVAASPVGVNTGLLDAAGLPAPRSPDGWYEVMRALLEAGSSERAAAAARLHMEVAGQYSFEDWLTTWASTLAVRGCA